MGECTLCSSNLTQHVPLRALTIFGAFLAVGTVYYDSQGCDKIVMCVLFFLLGFFLAFWALFLGNITNNKCQTSEILVSHVLAR